MKKAEGSFRLKAAFGFWLSKLLATRVAQA